MTSRPTVRTVTVHALDLGDRCVLLDRHGNRLSRPLRLSEIEGPPNPESLLAICWRSAVQRLKARLQKRCEVRQRDPWGKKTASLAASLRLRARFPAAKPVTRLRFECYSTKTWDDACPRLWEQANNRYRLHCRDGWVRWSHTVSNNHNKRKGGRYAQARYCDRQDDHANDRTATIPMRPEWSDSHSGISVAGSHHSVVA